VVEGVVGVVRGLDLGESTVGLVAVGLSKPAGGVVGTEEVDVDAGLAVRLEGSRNCRAQAVSAAASSADFSGSQAASMMMLWRTSRPP
jgi:hypothetical protein